LKHDSGTRTAPAHLSRRANKLQSTAPVFEFSEVHRAGKTGIDQDGNI
jgi:hypothetical protein